MRSFRVSRSPRQRVRSGRFEVTTDLAFERVMRLCARTGRPEQGCWLTEGLIRGYLGLHRGGQAHSVEAWLGEGGQRRLAGGLYGVHLGGLFAGESMVSLPEAGGTDASKVCLVYLVDTLRRIGARVLDVQFTSEHLARFGCVEVPADAYERAVASAVMLPCLWPKPGALPEPLLTARG